MNKIFDAHVHLAPARCVGTHEGRYRFTHMPFGVRRFDDGRETNFMPCYVQDSTFTAQNLIHLMDKHNVDHAMILLNLYYDVRQEIAEAVAQYPDRLLGAMFIEPSDTCEKEMDYWHARGLRAIKFVLGELGFLGPCSYPDFKFNAPEVFRILAHAEELGLTVVIDSKGLDSPGCQIEAFEQASKTFPRLRFAICHLGNPTPRVMQDRTLYKRWEHLLSLAERDNVWFDFSALTDRFAGEGYPFPTAAMLLKECVNRYGAEKFMWGSDIVATLNNATYQQMYQAYAQCPYFSEAEKTLLLHDTACKVYL